MAMAKRFTDLTDDEIRQIVMDIFQPKKITCIERRKRDDEIICKIYTEWGTGKENDETIVTADILTLKDPFRYGRRAIQVDFSVTEKDYRMLKQFCFAKGVTAHYDSPAKNNRYMKEQDPVSRQAVIDLIDEASRLHDEGKYDNWYEWLRNRVTILEKTETL